MRKLKDETALAIPQADVGNRCRPYDVAGFSSDLHLSSLSNGTDRFGEISDESCLLFYPYNGRDCCGKKPYSQKTGFVMGRYRLRIYLGKTFISPSGTSFCYHMPFLDFFGAPGLSHFGADLS